MVSYSKGFWCKKGVVRLSAILCDHTDPFPKNTSLRHSSPTLLYNTPKTLLYDTTSPTCLSSTSPTFLYNTSLQHSTTLSSKKRISTTHLCKTLPQNTSLPHTLLRHFSTRRFPSISLGHTSPTSPCNTLPKTFLFDTPTFLYNTAPHRPQHFS